MKKRKEKTVRLRSRHEQKRRIIMRRHLIEGMTVLHTDSDVKAAEFMRNEPLIRRGLRRFDLELWELREGTLSVATRLSDSSFALE